MTAIVDMVQLRCFNPECGNYCWLPSMEPWFCSDACQMMVMEAKMEPEQLRLPL